MKTLDISTETWREYDYLNGTVYRITSPKVLTLKDGSSAHRVTDSQGVTHWVPINVPHVIRWQGPVSF